MYRVLRDEPPEPAVVVAVPHQHQARVAVTLAPIAAAELERGQAAVGRGRRCPEGGGVLVECLAAIGPVECPEIALLVVAVKRTGPAAPSLRRGSREKYRRRGRCRSRYCRSCPRAGPGRCM